MRQLLLVALLGMGSALAQAAEDILIGQTADFSSVAAAQMRDFNAGAQAYLDKVNASGGIHGRPVKLVSLDDAFSADKAAANARTLIKERKVVALFGTRGTDPTEAVIKVAQENDIPLVAPITGADSVRASSVTFPVRASYRTEVDAMLKHMSLSPTRLGVLVQKDKFGEPLYQYIVERTKKAYPGIQLVGKVGFDRKATDLSGQAREMLAMEAQAVIALCNPTSCEAFSREMFQQARTDRRTRPTIYQTSITDIYAQFAKLGPDVVGGHPYSQILPDPNRIHLPITKEFTAAVARKPGLPVNYRTLEGFISAKVLVLGLQQAASLNGKGVQAGLESLDREDLGGFVVRYARGDHQGATFVDLVTMDKRGRLVH
jgi:ABC-type branched-subunit amino acid transport system substrate-binding protein